MFFGLFVCFVLYTEAIKLYCITGSSGVLLSWLVSIVDSSKTPLTECTAFFQFSWFWLLVRFWGFSFLAFCCFLFCFLFVSGIRWELSGSLAVGRREYPQLWFSLLTLESSFVCFAFSLCNVCLHFPGAVPTEWRRAPWPAVTQPVICHLTRRVSWFTQFQRNSAINCLGLLVLKLFGVRHLVKDRVLTWLICLEESGLPQHTATLKFFLESFRTALETHLFGNNY